MKAVRLHGVGDLRVEDVPAPEAPAPGWVEIRVAAAGICGSDLHNYRTGQWIARAPSIAGHEWSGVVRAVGAGVADFAPGDTVVADSRFWCGACPACQSGRRHLCRSLGFVGEVCDGGFAEAVAVPARLLHKHAPDLDPAVAAMAEPLAVALHAVARLAPAPGSTVLVAGCGTVGGLIALLLARLHACRVLIADRHAARAELVARATGAEIVQLDAGVSIGSTSGSTSVAPGGTPILAAVEATGSVAVLRSLLDLVQPGGSVALVGICHGKLDLDPNILVERELALLGCHAFSGEMPRAVALLPELAPALRAFIDCEIGLDAVPAAYDRLIAGAVTGLKTIIRPDIPPER